MSTTIRNHSLPSQILTIPGLFVLILLALPQHATATSDALPLAAGEAWRGAGGDVGTSTCFAVSLQTTGTLALELHVPFAAPRARLAFFGAQEPAFTSVARLHQSATVLVLDGEAGTYNVCVEAEDPRQPLRSFRLSSRFASGRRTGGEKSETDTEIEIIPDPAVDPLEGIKGGRFCARAENDDHVDGFLCATDLTWNADVHGEIGNDWGDDHDVFRFRLPTLATVEVRAGGESDLALTLYDGHGQRLDDNGGAAPRLVRTLVPGTYFVRLESLDAAAAPYVLSLLSP